ncbi:uncharacterized protein [Rutidosis leptorrhynchoides]|uniref:uncharacterized protein n=1 Tax=Rutidosis leptorrhynchoides TaxID=125765 RepID=UPI003A99AA46
MCMASVTLDPDKINKEKSKWDVDSKVYTRRRHKKLISTDTPITTASPIPATNNDQTVTEKDTNLQTVRDVLDDSADLNLHVDVENCEPRPLVTFVDDKVWIRLEASTSRNEIHDLKKTLKGELDQVRSVYQKLLEKEDEIKHYFTSLGTTINHDEITHHPANLITSNHHDEITHYSTPLDTATNHREIAHYSTALGTANANETYSQSQYQGGVMVDRRSLVRANSEMGTDYMDRRALSRVHTEMDSDLIDRRALMRVNSEVNPIANQEISRFRQLNVSVGEYVEKEKRTPKANQYYRNTDFLLGKDRLPPESNKRLKSNGGRKSDYSVSLERHKNQTFRSCCNLLMRLMKHKHGWVFNEPVNAKLLGLHDYHDIIKHPMDLGTVKSRLAQNFYKTPGEFADDVRLTFYNAMTYNPKGQDVHVMAETLLNIFEERWVVIESDWKHGMTYDAGTPTPTSKKTHQFRTLDRSQSMALPFMAKPKPATFAPVTRTPVPKKPKAKDLNKRDMTYEEKQKLSANLLSLSSEKLDNIVQIINKGNTTLSQNDDEIEVDIDSVDVETLWELDRFVTNYKKSLSKHKRKAELAQQARERAGDANNQTMLQNAIASKPEAPQEKRTADETNSGPTPPNQREMRVDNASRSSSSSSSSSDSSSSDSDSDSSSESDVRQ